MIQFRREVSRTLRYQDWAEQNPASETTVDLLKVAK